MNPGKSLKQHNSSSQRLSPAPWCASLATAEFIRPPSTMPPGGSDRPRGVVDRIVSLARFLIQLKLRATKGRTA